MPHPRTAVLATVGVLSAFAPVLARAAAPEPAKPVDASARTGRWYELARLHNRTEANCEAPTIDFAPVSEGKGGEGDQFTAVQTCHQGSAAGPAKVYRPKGRVLDPGTNAKMRLTYFPLVWRDYWVLDHAADDSWCILGDPTGRFAWIFTRRPTVPAAQRQTLVAKLQALGYPTAKLEFPAPAAG